MRTYYRIVIFSMALAAGCASANQPRKEKKPAYPHLVQLQKPVQVPHQAGKAYIDSLTQITVDNRKALLISGHFADGCTNLSRVSHQSDSTGLRLKITAWRNTERMCTQALVPFSYIYDISNQTLANHSRAVINGQTYSF